jgi:hypothetical protein
VGCVHIKRSLPSFAELQKIVIDRAGVGNQPPSRGVQEEFTDSFCLRKARSLERLCVMGCAHKAQPVIKANYKRLLLIEWGLAINLYAGCIVDNAGCIVDNAGYIVDNAGHIVDNAGRIVDNAGRIVDNANKSSSQ